jgi:hypothetical protein
MTYPGPVLVRWRDTWFDIEPPDGGYRTSFVVQTVGWLVRQDGDIVSVAAELLPDDENVRGITHIPEAAIVGDIVYLVPRQP